MALSKKDIDDLKPLIDRVVRNVMGFSEPTLITAAINCLDNGYDRKKTANELGSIIDDRQALGFAEKLFDVYNDYKVSSKTKKRKDAKLDDIESIGPKKKRFNEQLPPEPGQPSPGQLSADRIKEMMDSAQRMIMERKTQLSAIVEPEAQPMPVQQQQLVMNDAMEKAKRAAELQATIQAQLANAGLGAIKVKMPPPIDRPPQQAQPTSVILDEQGRTIDVNTGEAIELTHYQPTLKANIRAKKREQFKAVIQDKAPEEISEARFFDNRVGAKPASRPKRGFKFFEKGKFEQLASRLRTKAQLDRLQGEIASAAKKTGIASATKLAILQPKTDGDFEHVPKVEWWDAVILKNESYSSLDKDTPEGITHLVEHPAQMAPPAESKTQVPVMLTKLERKKLRRQNRNEAQKEVTEKIRLGLIPPPEPKVRMANLMRVLGTEAVQDPTKVEAHVRAQMAKRLKAHEEANANRKLTKEQKSQKKINKIKEDTSSGVHVSVYRVRDLANPSHKFKVETNAKQLMMTGAVVLHQDCNVVVAEGGPKQQKKFRRLMLHRIKWNEDKHGKVRDDSDSEDEESKGNLCVLVWEGTVKNRSYGDMKFKMCPTPSFAKEQFKKHSCEHYWDLAFSGSVFEAAGEAL